MTECNANNKAWLALPFRHSGFTKVYAHSCMTSACNFATLSSTPERTITQSPGTIKGVIFLTKARNVVQKSASSFFPSAFEEIIAMFSFLNCLTFCFGISETNYSTEFIKVILSSSIYIDKLHDKESFASPIEYNTYFSLIHREIRLRLHRLRSFLAKGVRII